MSRLNHEGQRFAKNDTIVVTAAVRGPKHVTGYRRSTPLFGAENHCEEITAVH